MRKMVLAIGGSSGSIYAHRLMQQLAKVKDIDLSVIITQNAIINWNLELGDFRKEDWPFSFYEKNDFMAPFASGSAKFESMIICPCSMGMMGRLASGVSTNLILRAADVMLKERRSLILVPRETPYNLIHLRNMTTLTEAGAIICPASPSFYSKPSNINELVDTVVHRILDLSGLPNDGYRWGE